MPLNVFLFHAQYAVQQLDLFRFVSARLLNEATGSLLDDVQLVNTLQTSKVTATGVSEQLEISEQTEIMIDSAREVQFFV